MVEEMKEGRRERGRGGHGGGDEGEWHFCVCSLIICI